MRLLFVMDPLASLHLAGDTSYALMLEAARRGHEIWTTELGQLGLEHDDPIAVARPTTIRLADTPAEAFAVGEATAIPLEAFGCVLMRKDPPVDVSYLQATWLLERARGKTLLINDPRGLRDLNEHLAVLAFPELTPPTIVTRSADRLRAFLDEQGGKVVVKPVDGYGGLGIFILQLGDPNLSSLIETATMQGRMWAVAQRFLPEAAEGDKRIVLVAGQPIGQVLRVPKKGEARGNLHVGGTAQACPLTEQDHAIIRALGPYLVERGQILVGLDVIGGRLTELNITSPTGIRHIDQVAGGNHSAPVLDWIEAHAIN